jgi:hypothetical protein
LLATWDGLQGGIEDLAVDFDSCQAPLLDEAERLLHFGVQIIRQPLSIVAPGATDSRKFPRGQEGPVAGEPDPLVRQPAVIVEASDFGQGIEAPTIGVAGEIVELLQFAKRGQIGLGAERAFQRRPISALVPAKVLAKDRGIEGSGPHNVRVLTPCMG